MSEVYKSVLETIRAKYQKTETVTDEHGRVIVVRRLDTPQQFAVREMSVSSDATVIGGLTLGASVVSIDDISFTFPRNRKDLDSTLYALDEKGLEAVAKAYEKLGEETGQAAIDAAKNLPATTG